MEHKKNLLSVSPGRCSPQCNARDFPIKETPSFWMGSLFANSRTSADCFLKC